MRNVFFLLILTSCITGHMALPEETGKIDVFFCDQESCEAQFTQRMMNATSLYCAMYHPTKKMAQEIVEKGKLVVDGDHAMFGAIKEDGSGLMHNKFCVIDERIVWTGSWNPAQGQTIANNVVVIESATLARAYQDEWEELAEGRFQSGKKGSAQVLLNGNLTEVYFCPEDDCKERIEELVSEAKESVHVMAYSFTDDGLGKLIEKKAQGGLEVRVIFDPRKDDTSSEYARLKKWSKVTKLHHKVFIIDEKTVITGSMNPTRNGDERNDENIVIMRQSEVARAFEDEFNRLWLI